MFNLKEESELCELDEHLKYKVFTLCTTPNPHVSRIYDLYKLCKSVIMRSALLFKLSEKSTDAQFMELTQTLIKEVGEIPKVFPPTNEVTYLILRSDFGKLYLIYKNLVSNPEVTSNVVYIKKLFETSRMVSSSEEEEKREPDDILKDILQILDRGNNLVEDFPRLYKVQALAEILSTTGTKSHSELYIKKVLSLYDKIKSTDDLMLIAMLILPMLKLLQRKDLIRVEALIMYYILSQKENGHYTTQTLLMLSSGLVQFIVTTYNTSQDLFETVNIVDIFSTLTYLRICKGLCTSCGIEASMTCNQCKISKYCSQKCQKSDWKNHKSWCGKLEPVAWMALITDRYKLTFDVIILEIKNLDNSNQ